MSGRGLSRPQRLLLLWLALSAPMGALPRLLAPWPHHRDQAINAVLGLATTVFVYLWCRAESFERGTAPPGRSALWAALLPPVGVPLYFWRTRGARPAAAATLRAALFYGATLAVFALVEGLLAP